MDLQLPLFIAVIVIVSSLLIAALLADDSEPTIPSQPQVQVIEVPSAAPTMSQSAPVDPRIEFEDLKLLIKTGEVGVSELTREQYHLWRDEIKEEDDDDEEDESEIPIVNRSTNSVVPIIFVSNDFELDKQMEQYLKRELTGVQSYYRGVVGKTFTLDDVSIVQGDQDAAWYWCAMGQEGCVENNFLHNLVAELNEKGYPVHPDWNEVPSDKAVIVAMFGGGGFSGTLQYPNGGALSVVGDAGLYAAHDNDCERIRDFYGHPDEPNNIKDVCEASWIPSGDQYGFGIGAVAHELGHGFGLGHPDADSIMARHWEYPRLGLADEEISELKESPYFNRRS